MTANNALDEALTQAWRRLGAVRSADSMVDGGNDVAEIASALEDVDAVSAAVTIQHWLARLERSTDRVSIVATGLSWVGGGTRSVEQTILTLIAAATNEILVTAYSLTSGSGRVRERLERAMSGGVRCVLIVNRLRDQPAETRAWLDAQAIRYPATLTVYDFDDAAAEGLHAKVLVVDRTVAVVGSANLSLRGMTSSHELSLTVRGPAASAVASAIDLLTSSPLASRVH